MTHKAFTVSLPSGTVKSKIPVTGSKKADSSSQGRAFPSGVLVRSMICPMITLVIASITLEMMGKTVKNSPPQSGVRLSTSV